MLIWKRLGQSEARCRLLLIAACRANGSEAQLGIKFRLPSWLSVGRHFRFNLCAPYKVKVELKRAIFRTDRFDLCTPSLRVKLCNRVVSLVASSAILFGIGAGSALADDECGEGVESGTVTEITCDSNSYDPSTDGNIVYLLGKDDPETSYTVSIENLSGDKAITLNDLLDSPYVYDTVDDRPLAIWITYAGSSDFTVNVSDVELRTGTTVDTGTSEAPIGDEPPTFAPQRGLQVWLENDTTNREHYLTARDLTLNIRNSEFHTWARAISAVNDWNGAINVDVRDSTIRTYGPDGHGIVGFHEHLGDVNVYVERVNIVTEDGHGIFVNMDNREGEAPTPYTGPVTADITVKDSTIEAAGALKGGLFFWYDGSGKAEVHVEDSLVKGTDGASGIVVLHVIGRTDSSEIDLDIVIDIINSEVTTTDGDGIQIIRNLFGNINTDSVGTNMITIGSSVKAGGEGHGINAQGNTVIVIEGLVSAESGNAITNTGGDLTLRILDHGMVDGLVTNEANSRTDIWVGNDLLVENGVMIQETGATAGAYDTTVSGDDPVTGFMFDRQYGPRAAVYEAMVATLFGLNGRSKTAGKAIRSPESPLWISVIGGTGSHEPELSTVGSEYKLSRYELEAGADFELNENLISSISARLLSGSADVSASTGGGEIGATGYGLGASLTWQGTEGFYSKGRLSTTRFNVDLQSDMRGALKNDVGASIFTLGLEAGKRNAVSEKTIMTPRAWLTRSTLSMGSFTDAIGANVSIDDAHLFTGGIGVAVETELDQKAEGEKLSLRGSLDVERTLSGGNSTVRVSGEQLKWTGDDSRILFSLGLTKRSGDRLKFDANLRVDGLGSKDRENSANFNFRYSF